MGHLLILYYVRLISTCSYRLIDKHLYMKINSTTTCKWHKSHTVPYCFHFDCPILCSFWLWREVLSSHFQLPGFAQEIHFLTIHNERDEFVFVESVSKQRRSLNVLVAVWRSHLAANTRKHTPLQNRNKCIPFLSHTDSCNNRILSKYEFKFQYCCCFSKMRGWFQTTYKTVIITEAFFLLLTLKLITT